MLFSRQDRIRFAPLLRGSPGSAARVATFLLALLLSCPQISRAQAEDAPLATPGPSATPAVFAGGEIALKWGELQEALPGLRSVAGEEKRSAEIAVELKQMEAKFPDEAAVDWDQLQIAMNVGSLEIIENRWRRRGEELAGWSEELQNRRRVLGQAIARSENLLIPWQATVASSAELSPETREIANSATAALDGTLSLIRGRRDEVLQLLQRIIELSEYPNRLLDQVREVRREKAADLLQRESPPLWTASAWQSAPAVVDNAATKAITTVEAGTTYFEKRRTNVLVSLLTIFFFALMAIALRSYAAREIDSEDEGGQMIDVLKRPISTGILLTMLFMPLLYPDRSHLAISVFWLVAAIPVIRVASPLLPRDIFGLLLLLSGWLVLDAARIFVVTSPLSARLFLLTEATAALIVALTLFQRERKHPRSGSALPAAFEAVGATLLLVAVVSNIVGNVSLAETVTEGILFSLITLVGAIVVAQVLQFMLALLLRTEAACKLAMVRRHREDLLRRSERILRLGLLMYWAWRAVDRFAIRQPVVDAASSVLAFPIGLGGFALTLGDILSATIVLWLSVWLSRAVRFVLDEDVLPRARLPRGVPYAVSVLSGYAILLLGALSSAEAARIDMSRFALALSALGVGIGIGMQDIVNNFVSGMILLFERPLQVGDTVEVGQVIGTVERIGLRSSTLKTFEGAERVVPNSHFASQEFTNWTLSDSTRRIEMLIGVAYGTEPEPVLEILREVSRAHPQVLEIPPPNAVVIGYGESSVDLSLRAWTGRSDQWVQTRSEILIEIGRRFAEAGIQIPFPQRDLHIIPADGAS